MGILKGKLAKVAVRFPDDLLACIDKQVAARQVEVRRFSRNDWMVEAAREKIASAVLLAGITDWEEVKRSHAAETAALIAQSRETPLVESAE